MATVASNSSIQENMFHDGQAIDPCYEFLDAPKYCDLAADQYLHDEVGKHHDDPWFQVLHPAHFPELSRPPRKLARTIVRPKSGDGHPSNRSKMSKTHAGFTGSETSTSKALDTENGNDNNDKENQENVVPHIPNGDDSSKVLMPVDEAQAQSGNDTFIARKLAESRLIEDCNQALLNSIKTIDIYQDPGPDFGPRDENCGVNRILAKSKYAAAAAAALKESLKYPHPQSDGASFEFHANPVCPPPPCMAKTRNVNMNMNAASPPSGPRATPSANRNKRARKRLLRREKGKGKDKRDSSSSSSSSGATKQPLAASVNALNIPVPYSDCDWSTAPSPPRPVQVQVQVPTTPTATRMGLVASDLEPATSVNMNMILSPVYRKDRGLRRRIVKPMRSFSKNQRSDKNVPIQISLTPIHAPGTHTTNSNMSSNTVDMDSSTLTMSVSSGSGSGAASASSSSSSSSWRGRKRARHERDCDMDCMDDDDDDDEMEMGIDGGNVLGNGHGNTNHPDSTTTAINININDSGTESTKFLDSLDLDAVTEELSATLETTTISDAGEKEKEKHTVHWGNSNSCSKVNRTPPPATSPLILHSSSSSSLGMSQSSTGGSRTKTRSRLSVTPELLHSQSLAHLQSQIRMQMHTSASASEPTSPSLSPPPPSSPSTTTITSPSGSKMLRSKTYGHLSRLGSQTQYQSSQPQSYRDREGSGTPKANGLRSPPMRVTPRARRVVRGAGAGSFSRSGPMVLSSSSSNRSPRATAQRALHYTQPTSPSNSNRSSSSPSPSTSPSCCSCLSDSYDSEEGDVEVEVVQIGIGSAQSSFKAVGGRKPKSIYSKSKGNSTSTRVKSKGKSVFILEPEEENGDKDKEKEAHDTDLYWINEPQRRMHRAHTLVNLPASMAAEREKEKEKEKEKKYVKGALRRIDSVRSPSPFKSDGCLPKRTMSRHQSEVSTVTAGAAATAASTNVSTNVNVNPNPKARAHEYSLLRRGRAASHANLHTGPGRSVSGVDWMRTRPRRSESRGSTSGRCAGASFGAINTANSSVNRGCRAQSETEVDSDKAAILELLTQHNERVRVKQPFDYVPPLHGRREVRDWEIRSGRVWDNLSNQEREYVNRDISDYLVHQKNKEKKGKR